MSRERAGPFDALVAIAWSRIWSPVVPHDSFVAAWRALELPGDTTLRDNLFCSTFHAGFPAPQVPLLLHAALNLPGDHVRIDMLRAMAHLGLKAGAKMLPPDHLAVACEVTACALKAGEPVMVAELRDSYLVPWGAHAEACLAEADGDLREIVRRFGAFAQALDSTAPVADGPVQMIGMYQ